VRVLIHRDWQALSGLDVEAVEGDIRDLEGLKTACQGVRVVYHLAAKISLRRDAWSALHAVNVVGSRNVVDACLDCGVGRLIHFSSIHAVQQEPLDIPIDETRPLTHSFQDAPYDRSKALAEEEVRRGWDRGLNGVILAPTGIIGPHDYRPSHFGQALLALARGAMPIVVGGGFDWVDVRDVVQGALTAERDAPAGSKYLLSGHWMSMAGLAKAVAGITGLRPPRWIAPMWLAQLGAPFSYAWSRLTGARSLYNPVSLRALQGNRDVCHDAASQHLDYHPRPLIDTIQDTLAWFVAAGMLPPYKEVDLTLQASRGDSQDPYLKGS
jgi:dihydroflavonol-4-reductase